MLAFSFFVTAMLYATVGFGGGSTYNALLVLADVDYRILPSIALICNLIVVSGGVYRFYRAGYIDFNRIYPWVITSVPAAMVGGYLAVSETIFVGLLGFSLLVAGLRMIFINEKQQHLRTQQIVSKYKFMPQIIGVVLGLIAGLVGIGGGIFLAPILYLLHWDNAKKIAATCSVFILVNSISGLLGQMIKISNSEIMVDITIYWLLFPAVLIGGQIGSFIGAGRLKSNILQFMTAVLILYVSGRLLFRWWNLLV